MPRIKKETPATKTKLKPAEKETTKNQPKYTPQQQFYYGIRTAKILENYQIGEEKMPRPVIKAMGLLKKAATIANEELKLLPRDKALKIIKATDEVINGNLDTHFPLSV